MCANATEMRCVRLASYLDIVWIVDRPCDAILLQQVERRHVEAAGDVEHKGVELDAGSHSVLILLVIPVLLSDDNRIRLIHVGRGQGVDDGDVDP